MAKREQNERKDITFELLKDRIIEVSNQFEIFQFDLANGKFSLNLKNNRGVSIQNAFSRIMFTQGETIQTSDNWLKRKWAKTISGDKENPKISLEVTCEGAPDKRFGNSSILLWVELYAKTPVITIRLQFTNDTGKPVQVKEFQPMVIEGGDNGSFNLGSSIRNWRFLKNGFQTSTPCYSLSLTELDKTCSVELFRNNYNPRSRFNPVKGEFDSDWVTAFKDNLTGNSAVIGFITMKDNMCQIDFKVDKEENKMVGLWARSVSDDIECRNNNFIESEKVLVDIVGPVSDALDRYAGEVAAKMSAAPWRKVLTGWCSWYEFFEKISEKLILNVIEYYKNNREKYPIEYIQVDDGYFTHRGDWTTTNELFPHGMKFIAEEIKSAGFKPGIWLSPFQISGGSKLFKEHPNWTIKDEKGNPIGEGFDASMKYSYYSLDCTNPEVIQWLKSLFKTVIKDWGYEYLKLDFLYAAAIDGVHFDKNATRAQALRRGLQAIRETVGNDIPVLGGLAPIGQAIGMVNLYRVVPDTATRWKSPWPFECGPALGDTMRNAVLRYFMHNKFWANDPDCVIARRGKERSDYPKSAELEYLAQGGTINEDEVRFEFTVLGILGGSIVYSDDPIHLPPEREMYLPLLLPAYQGKAMIVDLLEGSLPRILNLQVGGANDEFDLVGLLNWDDSPRDARLEFSKIGLKKDEHYHVFSFWDEKYLGRIKEEVTISNMPPHSASLLSIRKTYEYPQLVSSTIHITQGAAEVEKIAWNREAKTLDIMLSHPGTRSGKLFIHVPPSFKFRSMTSENGKAILKKLGEDGMLLSIELEFRKHAQVSIKFD